MKLSGQLSLSSFGGSVWVLRCDDGRSFQLEGDIPKKLEGKKVKVKGSLSDMQMGISMVGDIIEVQSIKAA